MRYSLPCCTLFVLTVLLSGCSNKADIVASFRIPQGTDLTLKVDVEAVGECSELLFTLENVPSSKTDRDYTDRLQIDFITTNGKVYPATSIQDVNGARRDVSAACRSLPKGAKVNSIRIRALKDVEGKSIRWWSGHYS